MMHFPLCFRFPPYFRKMLRLWKISKIVPFPHKISDFHPPKFLMTFFSVINHKFRTSPLFWLFSYISPLLDKIIISPYFQKFLPLFSQNSSTFYMLCVSFPP